MRVLLVQKVVGPKNKMVEGSCCTWMLPFLRKDVVLLTSCTVSVMSHFGSSMDVQREEREGREKYHHVLFLKEDYVVADRHASCLWCSN